jgi:Ser-tRNA(Ala) deacylase AlaX
MVKKVFWRDPYLTELETRVRSVDGDQVTLEETIFYAFSGGQESDQGTIGSRRVLKACKEGKEITYTLEVGHALRPGEQVRVEIDWERRYRLMRLHFAAELVLELINRKLDSPKKIGAHIAQDKARIDFECDQNVASVLPEIRDQALAIIRSDQRIISAFLDEANERRYWEVPGFTRVPCGGTHLKRTGEVGGIELKRKNVGKGKERVEIYVTDG